jgi:hypothetical protein
MAQDKNIINTPEYKKFISQVRKVCPEAADYLNDPVVIKELNIKPNLGGNYDINSAFTWTHSVQGHAFWSTLHKLVDYS